MRQTRPKHDRIQEIAFETHMCFNRAIVEWTRQGRNEIHPPRGTALEKATARDFDNHRYLGQVMLRFGMCRLFCLLHKASMGAIRRSRIID